MLFHSNSFLTTLLFVAGIVSPARASSSSEDDAVVAVAAGINNTTVVEESASASSLRGLSVSQSTVFRMGVDNSLDPPSYMFRATDEFGVFNDVFRIRRDGQVHLGTETGLYPAISMRQWQLNAENGAFTILNSDETKVPFRVKDGAVDDSLVIGPKSGGAATGVYVGAPLVAERVATFKEPITIEGPLTLDETGEPAEIFMKAWTVAGNSATLSVCSQGERCFFEVFNSGGGSSSVVKVNTKLEVLGTVNGVDIAALSAEVEALRTEVNALKGSTTTFTATSIDGDEPLDQNNYNGRYLRKELAAKSEEVGDLRRQLDELRNTVAALVAKIEGM